MFTELSIDINKNRDVCFSYTDRINSYLHIHCRKDKLTDGLRLGNLQLVKNICIFDKSKHKILTSKDFDKIVYTPYCVSFFYKCVELKLSLLLKTQTEYPVLSISFIDNENSQNYFPAIIMGKDIESPNLYDYYGNSINAIQIFDGQNIFMCENPAIKQFYCAFENNLPKEKVVEFNNVHVQEINNFFSKFSLSLCDKLTDATYWALFSGWMLVTGKTHRGIWAGLPWFRDNWGRDTFIALSGILLVSGQFEEAKSVIASFAEFQDKNPESTTYGRIPNRYVNKDDVIYNTADGNLWFVREVWEYLQYTGDVDFLNSMWDVIKLAIESDIKNRTDEFGFLLHGDADTWMDARIRGQQPLSPRGSRANDIQVLWYTTLMIGSNIAKYLNQENFSNEWKEKANLVKANFISHFLNEEKNMIADCLKEKNTQDFSIRPNLFFTFSVPNLLDKSESEFFTEKEKYQIIENAFSELAFDYGILSLNQKHEYFHPFHDMCKKHHKDAAYHNGTIWVWNSGPVIDSLCSVFHQNEAYKLSCFHAKQMLDVNDDTTFASRCAGSLSENINAYKIKNKIYPSGTWSQAWSVSEFSRNIFQSYCGIKPDLLNNKIKFTPAFPVNWKTGEVKFSFGNNSCILSWNENTSYKKKGMVYYNFTMKLEYPQNLEVEVNAFSGDIFKTKTFAFDENSTLSFIAGVYQNEDEFKFSKEKKNILFWKKPKSVRKNHYLFDLILSSKDSGYFTPVR